MLRTEASVSASLSVIKKPRAQASVVACSVKKCKQNPDCSEEKIQNSKSELTITMYIEIKEHLLECVKQCWSQTISVKIGGKYNFLLETSLTFLKSKQKFQP